MIGGKLPWFSDQLATTWNNMWTQLNIDRFNRILLFTILTVLLLSFGRRILILLAYSGFFAMLMTPVSGMLEKKGIPRLFSSLISILIIMIAVSGVMVLIYVQFAEIIRDLPQIRPRVENTLQEMMGWIESRTGIHHVQVEEFIKKALSYVDAAGSVLSFMILNIFTLVTGFLIVIVFTFLFLLNREKYENFAVKLFRPEKRDYAREIISRVSRIAQQYLAGRIIVILILSVLFAAGFLAAGLKNAILVAIITALVSIIPYIGPLLGGVVPLLVVAVYGSFSQAFWILVIVLVLNSVDNYFIEPWVSAGTVDISAVFTFLSMLAGYVLWGISGVILFLPILGIIKIIFENVKSLMPYAYLIGDYDPRKSSSKKKGFWRFKKGPS
jgi:predicted PurR-regulated permease PerM